MPTASSIVINDGQGTPAAHTFAPRSITPSAAVHADTDASTSAGQKQVILGLSPANGSRATNRVSIRLNMPVEHTVDGVVSVAYTARFNAEVVIPDNMTQAQRDDLAAFCKNLLAHSVVQGLIADLDPVY